MEAVHIKEIPAVAAEYLKKPEDKEQWDSNGAMYDRLAEQLDTVLERLDQQQSILEEILANVEGVDLSVSLPEPGSDEEYLTDMEEEDDDFAGGSELEQNTQEKE